VYPDEKHGIGGATRVDAFAKTIVWLNQYFPAK
jgi:hypothetical protein